jgi:hypothetical protein
MTGPSGTFNFAPSLGECVLNAFSRIRLRGPMVKAEHLVTAQMEANLMQQQWNNKGPNLWTQDDIPIVIACVPGQATYTVPVNTVMVTNVTIGQGTAPDEQELTITPVSRQMYSMYPNKQQQGRPTVYWFDRLIAPTITLWPVPDTNYSLNLYRFRIIQDALLSNGGALEVPVLWLDAACAGLAYRLAVHFAQDLEDRRKMQADEAYQIAATQNTEDAPLYILPQLDGYWR